MGVCQTTPRGRVRVERPSISPFSSSTTIRRIPPPRSPTHTHHHQTTREPVPGDPTVSRRIPNIAPTTVLGSHPSPPPLALTHCRSVQERWHRIPLDRRMLAHRRTKILPLLLETTILPMHRRRSMGSWRSCKPRPTQHRRRTLCSRLAPKKRRTRCLRGRSLTTSIRSMSSTLLHTLSDTCLSCEYSSPCVVWW